MTLVDATNWTGTEDKEAKKARLAEAEAKAQRWQDFCENDGLGETMDDMEAALLKAFADSKPRDKEGRELLYHRVRALKDIRQAIGNVIGGGKAAKRQLEELTKGKKSFF